MTEPPFGTDAQGSRTMRALRLTGYGDAAELVEAPRPAPGPGEVLVHVSGAALNPLDVKIAAGLMHDFFPVEFPYTLGTDLAGTVVGVGAGVRTRAVGDRVVTRTDPTAGGAVAEFAVAPADQLVPAPASVPLAVAAGLGTAAATAWQALHQVADVRPGQTVLVHAAAGGVGSFVVQLAHRAGAHVIATASGPGLDIARRLGADRVIDYTTTDVERTVAGVDVVVDAVGGDVERASLGVLKPGGLLVSLPAPPDAGRAVARGVRAEFLFHTSDADRLARVASLVDDGLEVVVDRTVPLAGAAQALRVLAAGRAKGKLIVRIGPG
jgi:NADPH:quinone reductase-like Zn-dependent oxidoreductase